MYAGLDHIHLPAKMRKRGRPKGSEKTAIGLPKKRKKKPNKPIAFIKKHPNDKDKSECITLTTY